MEGPERLEVGRPSSGRRTWFVVGLTVVVVAVLGLVRITGVGRGDADPGPVPTATSAPTATTNRFSWPTGVVSGTLFLLDADGVAAIDLSSGFLDRRSAEGDPAAMELTLAGPGVLVWSRDPDERPQVLDAGGSASGDVPRLRAGQEYLPGPGSSVWATTPGRLDAPSTWSLVEAGLVRDSGTSRPRSVRLRGSVSSDGSGGLFAADDERLTHVAARGSTSLSDAVLLATGPDGYEVLRCDPRPCVVELHDRSSGRGTALVGAPSDLEDAVLSPGNRFVAWTGGGSSADGATEVHVSAPGSATGLRSFSVEADDTALAWLSERWLAATTDDGLALYDAVADATVVLPLGLREPDALVVIPA